MFNWSIFNHSIAIEDASKKIMEEFQKDFKFIGMSFSLPTMKDEVFNLSLNSKDNIVLSLTTHQKLFYKINNKVLEVKKTDDLNSKLKYLQSKITQSILKNAEEILRQSKDFKNESDLKPLEWYKTTLRNFQLAINDCIDNQKGLAQYSIFFHKEKKQIFLKVFNFDLVFTFLEDPKIILEVYENKITENEETASSQAIFTHQFLDRSLEVFDQLIPLIQTLHKQNFC